MMNQNKLNFATLELQEWTKILKEELRKELIRRKISYSDELLDSLATEVTHGSDVNPEAKLIFKTYGRFVDMGAGRGYHKGMPLTDRTRLLIQDRSGRRPKKWYSKTAYGTLSSLIRNLVTKYQEATVYSIKDTIEKP